MDHKLIQSLLPALFLILATVGGWMAKSVGFTGQRPPSLASGPVSTHGQQTIETKLWKDPFAGLSEQISSAPDSGSKDQDKPSQIGTIKATLASLRTVPGKGEKEPAVVIAWVHSGGGAYEIESRRRLRHAMLAGLGVRGYVPEDENHIGLFAFPDPKAAGSDQSKAIPPFSGTFEWFEPANQRDTNVLYSKVIVLWLPENAFLDQPLTGLAQVANQLGRKPESPFSLIILGPQTTKGLFALCEDAARNDLDESVRNLKGARIYSASATTTDALLPPLEAKAPGGNQVHGRPILKKNLHEKIGVDFYNFAADDCSLTEALAAELELRGVRRESSDKILLVSEWHTDYGRALPLTFAANWALPARLPGLARPKTADGSGEKDDGVAPPVGDELKRVLKAGFGDNVREIQGNLREKLPIQFIKVSYLAGVDGNQKPGGQTESTPGKETAKPSPTDSARYPAFGDSQFDYMERLAARLDHDFTLPQADRDLRKKRDRVVAVGVLGSDFYDKLNLLQALRPKFPEALFFTTDLDARMLSTETRPWMRNLLVAARWDLQPWENDLSRSQPAGHGHLLIPPFRDSYQTAAYEAVRAAICGSRTGPFVWPSPPYVFEIGRHHAIRMPKAGEAEGIELHWRWKIITAATISLLLVFAFTKTFINRFPSSKLNPQRWSDLTSVLVALVLITPFFFLPSGSFMLLVCLGILIAGGLYVSRIPGPGRKNDAPFEPSTIMLWVAVALVLVVGAAVILVPTVNRAAEPIRWFEGVSLWPAEGVRLVAGLLGIYWIFATHKEIVAKGAALTETYQLGPETEGSEKEEKPPAPAGHLKASVDADAARPRVNAREKWIEFRKSLGMGCDDWKPCSLRQAPWVWCVSALLMVFWIYFVCFQPNPPRVPYRGAFSRYFDLSVLIIVLAVYTVLLVQVFDISRKTRRLIHELAGKPTDWPEPLLREKASNFAMDDKESHLDGWLDVRFVADLTQLVGNLVLRPFILLFLLLAATSHDFFDGWHMKRTDIIALSLANAALPLLCGVLLCREAEKARTLALTRLREATIAAKPGHSEKYKLLSAEIVECRRGAFRPIYEQPYVIALLIPLGGTGGIEILKRLLGA